MKNILLDTHALLWWLGGDKRLGKKAKQLIADEKNPIFVSAATIWEIAIKQSKGLLVAPHNMSSIVIEEGFKALPISLQHGEEAGTLPLHHKDPFDRMLIAQAAVEGFYLMTQDSEFSKYDVRLISTSR